MKKPSVLPHDRCGYDRMVSVLVPAYNAEEVLPRALASIQAQSFPDWEVIIADDSSTDDTADVARAFVATEPRARFVQHSPQQGAAATRNRALAAATGRYIAFLDADDAWAPEKLQHQLAHMAEQEAALGFTGFYRASQGHSQQVEVPAQVTYEQLLRGNCIGCLTAIYDRKVFGTVPMPDLPMRQDYALWLELLSQGHRAYGLNLPLATYHKTPKSLSSNRLRAMVATWRMYHQHFGLSRSRATFYLASHLIGRLRRG